MAVIKWVDVQMQVWGKAIADSDVLGYPRMSVEAKMQNGCLSAGSEACDGYLSEGVQKMEAAVLQLPDDLKVVARECYTNGHSRDVQAKIVARRINRRVGRRRLNEMLDQTHQRIAGFYQGS